MKLSLQQAWLCRAFPGTELARRAQAHAASAPGGRAGPVGGAAGQVLALLFAGTSWVTVPPPHRRAGRQAVA